MSPSEPALEVLGQTDRTSLTQLLSSDGLDALQPPPPPPPPAAPPNDGSNEFLLLPPPLDSLPGCCVEKLPNDVVVKSGRRVQLVESYALQFASQLNLPVPRLLKAERTGDNTVAIHMDFVQGQQLDKIWPNMSESAKVAIARQLRDILQTMRSVRCDSGLIGSINGGPARDCRRICDYSGGPFTDQKDFNKFILDLYPATPNAIRDALARKLRSDYRIVFSHGDLTQHNIIVRDEKIVALLDWEFSGWFPEYWDYIKFFERLTASQDWKNYATEIFPELYDEELILFQAITRWQNG